MARFHTWVPAAVALLIASGFGMSTALADDQVNTYTTANQSSPVVAMAADGDFVIVWSSYGSSGTDALNESVQGQRYASSGVAIGGEFQVNTYTTARQWQPSVAMAADGDFVVVWLSDGSSGTDASSWSVQGQRYASAGVAVGGEFQVNTYTTDSQWFPSVAMAADGNFVVAWRSNGSSGTDASNTSIQGQRYASDGSPTGGEFQINTYVTGFQSRPSVASAADGNFIVVWSSGGSGGTDSDSSSVQGQRYASDGSQVGGEFQVNTDTTGSQIQPAVALNGAGDFVVAWSTFTTGYGDYFYTINGQRYASDGSPVNGEFRASISPYFSRDPSVALGADGDFVVVWHDCSYFSITQGNILRRRYASDGSPVGGVSQVNTFTPGGQCYPSAAVRPEREFVVVWESDGSGGTDSDGYSIQRALGDPLFVDGFESGDTSAWSATTPP